jgi:hypothetical protein
VPPTTVCGIIYTKWFGFCVLPTVKTCGTPTYDSLCS